MHKINFYSGISSILRVSDPLSGDNFFDGCQPHTIVPE